MATRNHPRMIHMLKILPEFFDLVATGRKKFEARKDDRGFQEGDHLVLCEYVPPSDGEEDGVYTGRLLQVRVEYILPGDQFGVQAGYVVMSIEPVAR